MCRGGADQDGDVTVDACARSLPTVPGVRDVIHDAVTARGSGGGPEDWHVMGTSGDLGTLSRQRKLLTNSSRLRARPWQKLVQAAEHGTLSLKRKPLTALPGLRARPWRELA
jgi:hypothetical protein